MTAERENANLPIDPEEVVGEEYLTFRLDDEDYGVDILRVQEIRGWEPVTRIPNTPSYVKGVLNMRGSVVPVIDLRGRLELPVIEYGKKTVVIVVKVVDAFREKVMGMVVDSVSDVVMTTAENLHTTPQFGTKVSVEYVSGLVDTDGGMIALLDVDGLLCRPGHGDVAGEDAA